MKTSWLILAISFASGYWIFHYYVRKDIELRGEIKGLLWNSIFCLLITWKLSPLLFRTSIFLNDPIVLVYYLPGNKETIFAIVITIIFVMYQTFRLQLSFYSVFNSIFMIYVVASFIFYFFTEQFGNRVKWGWLEAMISHHPLHIYYMVLFLVITLWGLYTRYGLYSHILFRSYLSLISVGHTSIYFFKPYPYILGIHAQLFWLLFLVCGLILEFIYIRILKNKVQNRENGRLT